MKNRERSAAFRVRQLQDMVQPFHPASPIEESSLRYGSDAEPGISRRRVGEEFEYLHPNGSIVSDPETLDRIRKLAIPPAYEHVWISPDPNSHLQATGLDAKGRKQYRYHPDWTAMRSSEKFDRMIAFGKRLPRIRRQVDRDLQRPVLDRRRALAAVVSLLDRTLIRIGNEEYARKNRSYGLTTLGVKHVQVQGAQIRFRFRGKSGVIHEVGLRDRRLARVIRQLQELPGQELFTYRADDGEIRKVTSADVNAYLHEIAGESFSAKDFRTWAGTLLAFESFCRCEAPSTVRERKRLITAVMRKVARVLGNTMAICRKSYVHSGLIECAMVQLPIPGYRRGSMENALIRFLEQLKKDEAPLPKPEAGPA